MRYIQYIYIRETIKEWYIRVKKILADILKKTKDGERRYSQSRIYLLTCLTIMLGLIVVQLFNNDIDIERIQIGTDNLYYLILIFSGYALGEKVTDNLEKLKGFK